MLSAIIVALFLALPYVKANYFKRHKKAPTAEEVKESAGGDENA